MRDVQILDCFCICLKMSFVAFPTQESIVIATIRVATVRDLDASGILPQTHSATNNVKLETAFPPSTRTSAVEEELYQVRKKRVSYQNLK